MKDLKREKEFDLPIKVLQFGEGNFMRAFIDWMINRMNLTANFNGGVEIVQPLPQGMSDMINAQDGLYHVILRGVENGKVVENIEKISCVRGCLNPANEWDKVIATALLPELRFVFSNTTEAGIEYRENVDTFPAKVAKVITARAKAKLKGLVFIPCELIENNGSKLKECVLKYLSDQTVIDYVNDKCIFCNTLVDRIVAGYPKDEAAKYWEKLGVKDNLLVCGEPFHFFVIEGPKELEQELPFAKANLNVLFTDNQTPYRTRKVRFLNGAHTASVLAAHMAGLTFVDEMVKDKYFSEYLKTLLFEEIMNTIDLPEADKKAYAESIFERFANPYAQHRLLSIALNSVSKWRVRVLPTLLDYQKKYGKLPMNLTKSLASLIDFYNCCEIQDSDEIKAFFATKPSVKEILGKSDFWGMDLNTIPKFYETIKNEVKSI